MTASEKLIAFIRNTFDTALYFAVMAVKENFRNYIRRAGPTGDPSRGMVILGNGPSLSDDLPRLIARREYEAKDFMAVNFFAEDDRFEVVRPGYYVLSDPMFFRDSECRDRVAALYRTLDSKVTWPMTLYVQFYNPEKFDYRAALPNPRIRIVRFHTQVYRGFGSVGFWLFRHGLGSANFGTVVQVGEYVALLLGYRRIELYGVDHTLLDGLFMPGSTSMISSILSFGAFNNTYFLPSATWIASKRNNSSFRIACFSSDRLLLAINKASLCMMTSTSLS